MTCLNREVKVEISIVLYHNFSVFDLVHKNVAKTDLTLLAALYRVRSATQKHRMRKYVANTFDINENGSVSSHNVAVDVIVKSLR